LIVINSGICGIANAARNVIFVDDTSSIDGFTDGIFLLRP